MMFFRYQVNPHITLELQSPFHTRELFDLVNENRDFIGEHLAWVRKIQTFADINNYMQRDLVGMANERRWAWIIRYNGRVAGRIGLFITVPALQECELYYFLGKPYTGKGIMTESARAVIDFAINVLHLKHILIGFSPFNPKSGAVAERLGFQYEYTMRDAETHQEEWRSLHFWGILAEDWQSTVHPVFTYRLSDELNLQLYQTYLSEQQFKVIRANLHEFGQWFWWANGQFTLAKEKDFARKRISRYAKKTALPVAIRQEGKLVGNISLTVDSKNRTANIAYWLDKDARGKGLMTHSVRAILHEAFKLYRVERVGILTATVNTGSRALAERLGMQLELLQKDETTVQGQFVDHVQYGLLKEEWREVEA